jgi:hypothetical protein
MGTTIRQEYEDWLCTPKMFLVLFLIPPAAQVLVDGQVVLVISTF